MTVTVLTIGRAVMAIGRLDLNGRGETLVAASDVLPASGGNDLDWYAAAARNGNRILTSLARYAGISSPQTGPAE